MHDLDRFRFKRGLDFLESAGANISRDTRWLDLGCHQGQFCKLLVGEYGLHATGADDWDPNLYSGGEWEYHQADLSQSLPDCGPVDIVSALEVLEHMIDTDAFLRRIYELLPPGGWLLLSTPNINSLRNRVTVPLGVYPSGLEYRNVIHHVRLHNAGVLRQHLQEIGFVPVAIRGVAFLPLSSGLGVGRLSVALANALPGFCNNILAVAQKPGR